MTRSLPARTRVLAAGAALLITVGALAGCSDHPGQVANMKFIGLDGASHSIVISEKDIDVVAKDMEPRPGQANQQAGQERQTPTRVDIAGALIEAPIFAEVARAHGLTITDAQIVQLAKEQLGFEPRQASTLTYLRTVLLFNQFRQLQQQPEQAQAVSADLSKLRATLSGDRSPRYPDAAPAWWTATDPRLQAANNPTGGQQQVPQQQQQPQQGGGQQQPQQQAPQQQQPQPQQSPQQQQQQTPQQDGAEQPADSGQTESQSEGEQGADGGAAQSDGGAGDSGVDGAAQEAGQDTGQGDAQ